MAQQQKQQKIQEKYNLAHHVSQKVGASEDKVNELLASFKKQNITSLNSVEELEKALTQLGFWEPFITETKEKNFLFENLPETSFLKFLQNSDKFKHQLSVELFQLFDQNHDGKVSIKELMTGVLHSRSDRKKQTESLFHTWDQDGNGSLSRDEVKKMYYARRGWQQVIVLRILTISMQEPLADLLLNLAVHVADDLVPMMGDEAKLHAFLDPRIDAIIQKLEGLQKAHEDKDIENILNQIFEHADTDKNGQISKEEFVKYSKDLNLDLAGISGALDFQDVVSTEFGKIIHEFLSLSSHPDAISTAEKFGLISPPF
jgi:Ca2+-binding EF-hand superfamily protein